jgi:DNA-binding helix-hairpin-helix protein with protein kinase domain
MMSGILAPGDEVRTAFSALPCRIESLIGAGGQGEVYRAKVDGISLALKWYYDHTATADQLSTLRALINAGAPDPRFLWPVDLVTGDSKPGFGYLMALRDSRFKGIADLLSRNVSASFRSLATIGAHLADGFLHLHARGLCYRDISLGNVFFDPDSGDVLICDNDNVGPDSMPGGILGTPRFMAPEVIRREALPSTQTDLFSLAVLLFLILFNDHPLDGIKELDIQCFDLQAMTRLYGTEPVFIFDPVDRSNGPVSGYHDNAPTFWSIYPEFLKNLFITSFTEGVRDPDHGRVRESVWRSALSRLRDSIFYCKCGAENFYDAEKLHAMGGIPGSCWKCSCPLKLPPRMRIGSNVVMLNHDSRLFRHHVELGKSLDFTVPVAEVSRHPVDLNKWGLKNLTDRCWTATLPDGTIRSVGPSRSVALAIGTRLHFGSADGEIRL